MTIDGYDQISPVFSFFLDEGLGDEFLPTRSEDNATGWDVRCAERDGIVLKPFQKALINLGFKAIIPEGWWAELKPRSSTFAKKNLHCLYGTIDQNYTNNWKLAVQWIPSVNEGDFRHKDSFFSYANNQEMSISFGERIAQIIPVRRQKMVVSKINESFFKEKLAIINGGRDGFGSSGDK